MSMLYPVQNLQVNEINDLTALVVHVLLDGMSLNPGPSAFATLTFVLAGCSAIQLPVSLASTDTSRTGYTYRYHKNSHILFADFDFS